MFFFLLKWLVYWYC